jgi:hypothetical protein
MILSSYDIIFCNVFSQSHIWKLWASYLVQLKIVIVGVKALRLMCYCVQYPKPYNFDLIIGIYDSSLKFMDTKVLKFLYPWECISWLFICLGFKFLPKFILLLWSCETLVMNTHMRWFCLEFMNDNTILRCVLVSIHMLVYVLHIGSFWQI